MSFGKKVRASTPKLYRFVNRIVRTSDKDKSNGIIKYGINNKFPQELIQELNESGTATLCIDKLSEYCFAYGLTDSTLGSKMVNKSQNLNQLLFEGFRVRVTFRGLSFHISRLPDGAIGEVKLIPFENIRLTENGDYLYNETFSCEKYDKTKDIVCSKYKGKKINPVLINPNGEIFYYFIKRPMQSTYPIPSYYSSIEDINTDSELSKYELETVTNGFLPSGMLEVVGDIDDETEDDYGKTELDHYEETLAGFTGAVKDKSGASGRASLLVFYKKTQDELGKYTPFANEGILNAADTATKRIANKVARSFGVPGVLIGLVDSYGFATQVVQDQITLFNNTIYSIQNEVMEALSMLFDGKFQMTQMNPLKNIDPQLYSKLTTDELRDIIDYKPLSPDQPQFIKYGDSGTNTIIGIIGNSTISVNQKRELLSLMFGLSIDQIDKLVPITQPLG